MQSTAARLGVLAAVIAVGVVLFIVFRGGGDGGDESPHIITTATGTSPQAVRVEQIAVKNGEPVGGVKSLTFDKGDQVKISVTLDRPAQSVHVHGYEIIEPAANSPVRLSFPADIDGIFEIEVHNTDGTDTEIGELRVNP